MMPVNLKKLIGKLNNTTRSVLEDAAGLCVSRTHYDIEIEHVLLKLLDSDRSDFDQIINAFAIDRSRLTLELQRFLDRLKSGNARGPSFSPTLLKALIGAWVFASLEYDATEIRTGFVIASLIGDEELSKIVHETSAELKKLDARKLWSDFPAIVHGSVENNMREPSVVNAEPEPKRAPRVFISYRREDGLLYPDFIFTCLLADVPDIRVFRDTDTLKPGMVFSEKIVETVTACDILLAVIGKKWLGVQVGQRRIDIADDWVRLEIATALKEQKIVIPCLVGGAKMPPRSELPADIADLVSRHAIRVSQKNLRGDLSELIDRLKTWRSSMQ